MKFVSNTKSFSSKGIRYFLVLLLFEIALAQSVLAAVNIGFGITVENDLTGEIFVAIRQESKEASKKQELKKLEWTKIQARSKKFVISGSGVRSVYWKVPAKNMVYKTARSYEHPDYLKINQSGDTYDLIEKTFTKGVIEKYNNMPTINATKEVEKEDSELLKNKKVEIKKESAKASVPEKSISLIDKKSQEKTPEHIRIASKDSLPNLPKEPATNAKLADQKTKDAVNTVKPEELAKKEPVKKDSRYEPTLWEHYTLLELGDKSPVLANIRKAFIDVSSKWLPQNFANKTEQQKQDAAQKLGEVKAAYAEFSKIFGLQKSLGINEYASAREILKEQTDLLGRKLDKGLLLPTENYEDISKRAIDVTQNIKKLLDFEKIMSKTCPDQKRIEEYKKFLKQKDLDEINAIKEMAKKVNN